MTISYDPDQGAGSHAHGLILLSGVDAVVETIGEQSSELYLEEFEDRLRTVLRPVDKLVKMARDKYCMVLQGANQRTLVELAAAKLEREMQMPVEVIGDRLLYKFNAGFAVPDHDGCPNKIVLQSAESALRLAVATHQPCIVTDSGTVMQKATDPHLLPRLAEALELGELVLYYQAKADAGYGNIVGAEGLVRWHDSKLQKVIYPDDFIEVVENSDLVKPLTEYLIRTGIARCVEWTAPLTVAVNVPPIILVTADVVAVVRDALTFFGLEPERLILEITERGELPGQALAQLEALRKIGVKISIDDFGTGQCSLSYFRDLPADQVKIDRTFVQAMKTSHKDKSIVRGCIDLAHHCEMQVVAEGVEDAETAEELKAMGCDILQGYWIGRPLEVEEFERVHLLGQSAAEETDYFSTLLQ